jgi:ribosome-associated toxin RatA of RatAB toxin-antitoxin module
MTTTMRLTWLLGAGSLLALGLAAPELGATPTEEAARLMKLRDSERYEVDTAHGIRAGAARVHVAAPVKVVARVVQSYAKYSDFMPRFEKSRVVGRSGKKTDVYLQVPILKGAARIWAVLRMEPPRTRGDETVIRGKMIKGNVKRLDATWRITRIDADNSQLNLEMLIVPSLPVPGSMVTGEVAFAADKAVMGSRERAEALARAR